MSLQRISPPFLSRHTLQNIHHFNIITMTKKDVLTLVLKLIVGVAVAVGAVFGISVMSSCSAYKQADTQGHTSIITVDSTSINHSAGFSFKIKKD